MKRHSFSRWLATFPLMFGFIVCPTWGDEIRGTALLQPDGCPLPNLTVEIDPALGSPQSKILTATSADGSFSARLMAGKYLLVIFQQSVKVYQAEVSVSGITTLPAVSLSARAGANFSCNTVAAHASAAAVQTFSLQQPNDKSASPIDLAFDSDYSFLVLDSRGSLRRMRLSNNRLVPELLFTLGPFDKPGAVAANESDIMVTSNNTLSCNVYVYQKSTKRVSSKTFGTKRCVAIAMDGPKVYIAFDKEEEVRVWSDHSFGTQNSLAIPGLGNPASMAVDQVTHELFVGDTSGNLYSVRSGAQPKKFVHDGPIMNSIGIASGEVLVASDGTVTCYSRQTYTRQPKSCIATTSKVALTGVRVDAAQNAWLTDSHNNQLTGPYSLR